MRRGLPGNCANSSVRAATVGRENKHSLRYLTKMPMKNNGDGDSYVIPTNVPAFLVKLWKLVEDPQYREHISWNKNGTGFLVHDQATFAREILPKYFKHNNFASFVRQLNMYGFRKVIGAEQGGLRSEKDEWEFFNQNFQKSQPDLLENVKRKAAPDERKMKSEDVAKVLNDVQSMKGKQDEMTQRLDLIRRENEALWQELVDLRQKHQRQQQIVNKLFQFLMRLVYQNERLASKRSQLMLQDSSEGESTPPKRPRTSYSETSRSGPRTGQPPAYSHGPSTQTVTISDISNQPTHSGIPTSTGPSTSGPLITALPDEDVSRPCGPSSSGRPVIVMSANQSNSAKPIVSSPVMTTAGPSYPHATVLHPGITTGVVTFPEDPPRPPVVHPTHILEPTHYTVPNRERRAPGPIRQYSEEEVFEQRNNLGEHVDYISANLEALQNALQTNQGLLDGGGLSDLLSPTGMFNQDSNFMQQQMPQGFNMDFLEGLSGLPSPLPASLGGASNNQGNELIHYGNQGPGANYPRTSRSPPQYGHGDWGQGAKNEEYDVNNLFNG